MVLDYPVRLAPCMERRGEFAAASLQTESYHERKLREELQDRSRTITNFRLANLLRLARDLSRLTKL